MPRRRARIMGRHGKAVRECSPEPSCPQPGRSLSGSLVSEWLWKEADGVPHGNHCDPLATGSVRSVHLLGPCGPWSSRTGPPPRGLITGTEGRAQPSSHINRPAPPAAAKLSTARSWKGPECGLLEAQGQPSQVCTGPGSPGDRGTALRRRAAALLVTDHGPPSVPMAQPAL